jgi:hypothetical protein
MASPSTSVSTRTYTEYTDPYEKRSRLEDDCKTNAGERGSLPDEISLLWKRGYCLSSEHCTSKTLESGLMSGGAYGYVLCNA